MPWYTQWIKNISKQMHSQMPLDLERQQYYFDAQFMFYHNWVWMECKIFLTEFGRYHDILFLFFLKNESWKAVKSKE